MSMAIFNSYVKLPEGNSPIHVGPPSTPRNSPRNSVEVATLHQVQRHLPVLPKRRGRFFGGLFDLKITLVSSTKNIQYNSSTTISWTYNMIIIWYIYIWYMNIYIYDIYIYIYLYHLDDQYHLVHIKNLFGPPPFRWDIRRWHPWAGRCLEWRLASDPRCMGPRVIKRC